MTSQVGALAPSGLAAVEWVAQLGAAQIRDHAALSFSIGKAELFATAAAVRGGGNLSWHQDQEVNRLRHGVGRVALDAVAGAGSARGGGEDAALGVDVGSAGQVDADVMEQAGGPIGLMGLNPLAHCFSPQAHHVADASLFEVLSGWTPLASAFNKGLAQQVCEAVAVDGVARLGAMFATRSSWLPAPSVGVQVEAGAAG